MSADGGDDADESVTEGYHVADDGEGSRERVTDLIEEAEPLAATDRTASTGDPVGDRSTTATDADDEGAVAGSIAPDLAVTPQMPTPENTIFVALGIYIALLVLADATVGLYPLLVVVAFVVVGITTATCYGILVLTIPDT